LLFVLIPRSKKQYHYILAFHIQTKNLKETTQLIRGTKIKLRIFSYHVLHCSLRTNWDVQTVCLRSFY